MEGHGEAAADIITGGVIGRAVEPDAGSAHDHGERGKCRNCGNALAGAYCYACGQPAQLHRSLSSERKSTRLNSSHSQISYAVFCLKKKKNITFNAFR